MQEVPGERQRGSSSWIRIALILLLGTAYWLSRTSPPDPAVTLALDPSYQQSLGVALAQGMRFGREIVFTSGPLAYFTYSPYVPELFWAKCWLWEGLLGAAIGLLLFSRLVRRGTWLDLSVGVLVLIVLPKRLDEVLFFQALLAADLVLEAMEARPLGAPRWPARLQAGMGLLLLSILCLIKVTSLTMAMVVLAILLWRAASSGELRGALRWLAAAAATLSLVWICIGQKLQDLPSYLYGSIELAGGFSSAMSLAPGPRALEQALGCLALGAGLCAVHLYQSRKSGSWRRLDSARTQALLVLAALLLAYKSGFTRADHCATLFGTAMIAPLFLIPIRRAPSTRSAWMQSGLRCSVILLAMLPTLTTWHKPVGSPGAIARDLVTRIQSSIDWMSSPSKLRLDLVHDRERLLEDWSLPRIKAVVGDRGVCVLTIGHGVLFLNDLRWKPRPVFQSFSVFTQRSARANAEFLASDQGPDFVLLRAGTIDRRLPPSEDPLSVQVLLRDFKLRVNEGGFLLLERASPRPLEARTTEARGELAWNERLALPAGDEPLVLRARIRPSLLGRLRSALYQTPAVTAEVEFESGIVSPHRIMPFALEAGVVVRPCLPLNGEWISYACGGAQDRIVAMRFHTAAQSAFQPRIEYEFQRAPDLRRPIQNASELRELVLGALRSPPLRLESPSEPTLMGWVRMPATVYIQSPASLVYAAGPGKLQLTAKLSLNPKLAKAGQARRVQVAVLAHEQGVQRECARYELGVPGSELQTGLDLDVEVDMAVAGELRLVILQPEDGDPRPVTVGIRGAQLKR
ncbi:MAG TPA: hypothetical protein VK843_15830 [Planctomycetota bacterium]|nr:hypothetical protein [Planctomycetota bacterium]